MIVETMHSRYEFDLERGLFRREPVDPDATSLANDREWTTFDGFVYRPTVGEMMFFYHSGGTRERRTTAVRRIVDA